MVAHRFGGSWTDRKLNALAEYLIQYRVIFTKNPWAKKYKTIYVDAFAGTGEREVGDDSRQASLFGYDEEKRGFQAGSVKVALTLKSKFDKYIFIDSKAKHATALKELLRNQHAELAGRCDVRREDANRWLQEWCRTEDWTKQRAVVFLDPYGMDVEWVTIEAIAKTQAIDLWVLFPFAIGANRMLPRDTPPDSAWARRLTAILGTDEWKQQFYRQNRETDLLGMERGSVTKIVGADDILKFFLRRLESVFAKIVQEPLILENSNHVPMYALCFAAGNRRGAPTAVRIASHLTRT